jgi:hypothetical protein
VDIRTIELTDNFELVDKKDLDILTKHTGVTLKGEVTVTNEFGELLFKKHNLIVVSGRLFVLEKIFGLKSPLNIVTLPEQIGLPQNIQGREDGPTDDEIVCLFMVGNGGAELTFGDVIAPGYKDTILGSAIPFRFVDANRDLSDEEKEKYKLKLQTVSGKNAYFCKTFETTPEIKVKRIGTDIDVNYGSQDQDFDLYVDLNLKIDSSDLREYYTEGEGLQRARINEIGLVIGKKPENPTDEYSNLQLFTRLTFNNEALDSNTKELNINYRIYA